MRVSVFESADGEADYGELVYTTFGKIISDDIRTQVKELRTDIAGREAGLFTPYIRVEVRQINFDPQPLQITLTMFSKRR